MPESSASRPTALIGEIDERYDAVDRRCCRYKWCDVVQHQLRAPKRRERAVAVEVAPGQVDEAFATTALDRRSAEINARIGRDDVGFHDPLCGRGIAGNQVDPVSAFLDPDVDVVERLVGVMPSPAGLVVSMNLQQHPPIMAGSAGGGEGPTE